MSRFESWRDNLHKRLRLHSKRGRFLYFPPRHSTATIRPSCGVCEISLSRKPGHIALSSQSPTSSPLFSPCADALRGHVPSGTRRVISYHLLHPGSTTRIATAPLSRRVAHAPLRTPVTTCPHAPRLRPLRHPPLPPHLLIPPNSPTPSDNSDYLITPHSQPAWVSRRPPTSVNPAMAPAGRLGGVSITRPADLRR